MVVEAFINNTLAGVNNPECSFFVGATVGQYLVISLLWKIALFYFLIRIIDSWIFTPITRYVKRVFRKKRLYGVWEW